jgi:hypothetical protein
MHIRFAVVAASLALGLAACGDDVVSQDEVEKEVKSLISEQVGEEPKEVDCPEDLKAEKGEKMRCKLVTKKGEELGAEVVVTSVDGDKANFSVEVVQ